MSVNEIRDLSLENYYKRIVLPKENSQYSIKRLKRKDLLLLEKIQRLLINYPRLKERVKK